MYSDRVELFFPVKEVDVQNAFYICPFASVGAAAVGESPKKATVSKNTCTFQFYASVATNSTI